MRTLIIDALRALGVEQLVCAIHDRCLPALPEEDIGCGAPGSRGADDFLAFVAELGFTGVQLGPPGRISAGNLSPYDGTVFSRSALNLAWQPIVDGADGPPLLRCDVLADAVDPVGAAGNRCDYPRAFRNQAVLLERLHTAWDALEASGGAAGRAMWEELAAFRKTSGDWLLRDGLYAALSAEYDHAEPRCWPSLLDSELFSRAADEAARARRIEELQRCHARPLTRYAREQMLLAEQHRRFRERAHLRQLTVFADLQIGLSLADRWGWADLMLDRYWMGAPPSRTNPEGQPWGYPVFDPALINGGECPGPALRFQQRRFEKLFAEYDGVRIDHPHGLVSPWIYRDDSSDLHAAVQGGTRLFSVGPAATCHEDVARFDITRPEQLAMGQLDPWADGWVTDLDEAQVDSYARVFDALLDGAGAAGVRREHVLCEVLSTEPYPLQRVRKRHGLGRFRVTSKADVNQPDDVYLPQNAQPEDWIMVGTHDTVPVWHSVKARSDADAGDRIRYAAEHLAPDGVGREALAAHFSSSRDALALAEFALLFTSPAHNVLVFVCDLLGEQGIYNRPGVAHPENWTWRVAADFRATFAARIAAGAALDLPAALALATAALPLETRRSHEPLIRALSQAARAPLPNLEPRLMRRGNDRA